VRTGGWVKHNTTLNSPFFFVKIVWRDTKLLAENFFPKTPNPKPARIPPQTPPAGGKSAEAGRIHSPRQIVSPCLVRISIFNHLDFARKTFELCPTNTANRNTMKNSKLVIDGLVDAVGVAVYIVIIATIMRNIPKMFGTVPEFFGPVVILLLFVLSAAITGGLVLGRPVLLYFDGKRSDAIKLFFSTVFWLFVIMLFVIVILIVKY